SLGGPDERREQKFATLVGESFLNVTHKYFTHTFTRGVKADDKIPNIAGIKFPTYNRTIVSTRGAMVHDYERGIFYDQRDV
ncbi:hypothetical protein, partial [Anoxybacillus pushchinoensis]|uniref:hypothetical protein n=1 Tax=Anoxybacillus pushchinoensis TaxID=150248 RepID=UPI001ABFD34F